MSDELRRTALADPALAPRRVPWTALALAALTLLVLAWSAGLAWTLWADLSVDERVVLERALLPRRAIVVLFVLLLPLVLAALVWPWIASWPHAARRLREEVAIVATTHAGHRMTVAGAPEMRELASAVDALAQAHEALRHDVDRRVAAANARLAEETQRLAALMAQLPQGVLVCNSEGRILLYNERAAQVLAAPAQAGTSVGLGRPLAALLDADALAHARQRMQRRLERGEAQAIAQLVIARRAQGGAAAPDRAVEGALLRVQMVPIGAGSGAAGGAGEVLIIDDITRSVAEHSRRDAALLGLTEGTRSALGNLRAAAQTLQQYPAMDDARRQRFTSVVHEEAERLAVQLAAALAEPDAARRGGWPVEDVQIGDLVFALQHGLRAGPGIECRFDGAGAARWLEVDSHALVQALVHLIARLVTDFGARDVAVAVREAERLVRLDIEWRGGEALDGARLREWQADAMGPASALREVLDRHGAEGWLQRLDTEGMGRLSVQLVAGQGALSAVREARQAPRGRPISYDFDLFNQAGQNAALDDTPLAALTCTVFDTETTGLRPSEGDEIIALGAVRIVNARLLEHETFDRRVCPRRPVRASAQAVHGISTEQLAGEPPLEQVLPAFARFCEDTVLVAHNAAFDMRLLELARERTSLVFDQPVLDTLLLAAVVQPGHRGDEHHLEQIAERLGVEVVSRHQALGDAIVTGRVFLKLLPLLAARGIVTLGQARAASQRTVQARESF